MRDNVKPKERIKKPKSSQRFHDRDDIMRTIKEQKDIAHERESAGNRK